MGSCSMTNRAASSAFEIDEFASVKFAQEVKRRIIVSTQAFIKILFLFLLFNTITPKNDISGIIISIINIIVNRGFLLHEY